MQDADSLLADNRYYSDRSRFHAGPESFSVDPASLKYLVSRAKVTYACPEHSETIFRDDLKKIGYNKFFILKTSKRTKAEKQSYSSYVTVDWTPALKLPENVAVKDIFDKGNRKLRVYSNAFVGYLVHKGLNLY